MRALQRSVAARAAAVVLLASVPAAADVTMDQCVSANASAQDLRRAGKLSAARERLRECSDASCPGIVRDDCTQRLDELERAQPTVIFDVKDGAGRDLIDVTATVDGQPLAHGLDGSALSVDPGNHVFVFTEPRQPPVTQAFVLKEGERGRRERIVIGTPPAPVPTTRVATPEAARPASGLGTQRILGIALGGAGVAALGVGSVFGLLASSSWSSAKSACGGDTSHCADATTAASYRSTTETDATIATVGFVAGGVLLAAGAVLFFTGGSHESGAVRGVALTPSIGPGQGSLTLRGAF